METPCQKSLIRSYRYIRKKVRKSLGRKKKIQIKNKGKHIHRLDVWYMYKLEGVIDQKVLYPLPAPKWEMWKLKSSFLSKNILNRLFFSISLCKSILLLLLSSKCYTVQHRYYIYVIPSKCEHTVLYVWYTFQLSRDLSSQMCTKSNMMFPQ